MCGICGFVGKGDEQLLNRMMASIAHRGPDDSGAYIGEARDGLKVGLGHLRLSIIDLSPAGHQPMPDDRQEIWLTFNGEIYNFQEIKAELRSKGYEFRSATDTEVIINAYREWGQDCLKKLNGMFAFALWDCHNNSLFIARDRLGIKPLYYTETGLGLAFASEIKALLEIEDVKREIDIEALHQYLSFLWVPDPKTLFKGIFKLPPGYYAIYKGGRLQTKQYWDLRFEVDESRSERYWREQVLESLSRAVRLQMISDVPLGAFLSGGVDSSSIVALMSKLADKQVQTYTIGFKNEDLRYDIIPDDVQYARQVGKLFNTLYNETLLEPQVVDLLPRLVYHLDEPIADPAIISSYLVCRAARETLTVLLSGMGGDEIFAGYPRHLAVKLAEFYNLIPQAISNRVTAAMRGGGAGRLTALMRNTKKLARSAAQPAKERYLGFGTYFTEDEKYNLYSDGLRSATRGMNPYDKHLEYFDRVKSEDFINQMLYIDIKTFLPCLNLTYTDKTSMATSLEVRVPFLDHELVELTARIPPSLKLRGFKRKYILKRSVERLLPKEIIYRKKAGFSAPVRAWLVKDLRDMVEDLLSEANVIQRGHFNYRAVRQLIDDNLTGKEDNSLKVFQLLTLELWQRTFLK